MKSATAVGARGPGEVTRWGSSGRAAKSGPPLDGPPDHARRCLGVSIARSLQHDSTVVGNRWPSQNVSRYDDGDIHRLSTARYFFAQKESLATNTSE